MYLNVLDHHAPTKSRKCKSTSGKSKFITPDIRKTMRKRNALKHKSESAGDWENNRVQRMKVVWMRHKSIINHFYILCDLRAGNPRDFWKSLQPLIHTRKCVPKRFHCSQRKRKDHSYFQLAVCK